MQCFSQNPQDCRTGEAAVLKRAHGISLVTPWQQMPRLELQVTSRTGSLRLLESLESRKAYTAACHSPGAPGRATQATTCFLLLLPKGAVPVEVCGKGGGTPCSPRPAELQSGVGIDSSKQRGERASRPCSPPLLQRPPPQQPAPRSLHHEGLDSCRRLRHPAAASHPEQTQAAGRFRQQADRATPDPGPCRCETHRGRFAPGSRTRGSEWRRLARKSSRLGPGRLAVRAKSARRSRNGALPALFGALARRPVRRARRFWFGAWGTLPQTICAEGLVGRAGRRTCPWRPGEAARVAAESAPLHALGTIAATPRLNRRVA